MRVIVILSDTFRYDHVGCFGKKPIETPSLDAFASEATVFHRHYCGSFPTVPNREDNFTGKTGFPSHGWAPLAKDAVTLADLLGKAGVVTQLITDTPHMMKLGFNYQTGFTSYYWVRGQEADHHLTRLNYPIDVQIPHDKTRTFPLAYGKYTLADMQRWDHKNHWNYEEDRMMSRVANVACEWLQDNYKADNFMLWLDFFDPHEPWDPPEYFVKKYDPDYEGTPMFHPNYGKAEWYTDRELRNLQAHYAAEVTLVDKQIGRVLRMIKDTGIWEDTMIVFTTDHGMYLGEHNYTGKSNINTRDDRGNWCYLDEIVHTPLIVKPAGGRKTAGSYQLVQPVDNFASILDAFGVSLEGLKIDGRSYLPLLNGQDVPLREMAFSASILSANDQPPSWTTINDGEWTLCFGGRPEDENQLFHTASDPQQLKNVWAEERGQADRLYQGFVEFLKSIGTSEERMAEYQKVYAKA